MFDNDKTEYVSYMEQSYTQKECDRCSKEADDDYLEKDKEVCNDCYVEILELLEPQLSKLFRSNCVEDLSVYICDRWTEMVKEKKGR